jgi:hypothetical protein
MENDPYAKDAQIKEDYKEMNEGARLRMDTENYQVPYHSQVASCDSPKSLKTIEQEKNRLTRQLNQSIVEEEIAIRTMRNILDRLEQHQKRAYSLRDSINQSSQIQMDQVKQLREHLK